MNNTDMLFQNKKDCCGCGACYSICPVYAIKMEPDECGFIYPSVDLEKCVSCGMCSKVCAYQNVEETNTPLECYAAVNKDKNILMQSSSGGAFSAVATEMIRRGGVVYGAAYDEHWKVRHIGVKAEDDLKKLRGSKYVHSEIGNTFVEAKTHLEEGREVLFSGTPCQIAGLKSYLGKEYENLLTIDLVCHGVPSNKMFGDYVRSLEKKRNGKVESISFRDKSLGWGKNGCVVVDGKRYTLWGSKEAYLYGFLQGSLFRENCYSCKYTCRYRPANITIGDFWGIELQHPEYLRNGWNENRGISCVIANDQKGRLFLEKSNISLELKPTTFEKIAKRNNQLNRPATPKNRDDMLKIYADEGWESLEKTLGQRSFFSRYSSAIKHLVPVGIKRFIKRAGNGFVCLKM